MATSKFSVIIHLLELQIGRAELLYRQTKKEFDAGRVVGLKEACTLAKTFCDDPPPTPPSSTRGCFNPRAREGRD